MHDVDTTPWLAVIVTVSPVDPPLTDIVGVVSEVTSSDDDEPESDDVERSTPIGALGAAESMMSVILEVDVPAVPAALTADADTVQEPFESAGRSQAAADPTVYVQLRLLLPFDAVTVTTSPAASPGIDTVGVVSEVTLSTDDEPVSDAALTSG